jgi:hypothetical protein
LPTQPIDPALKALRKRVNEIWAEMEVIKEAAAAARGREAIHFPQTKHLNKLAEEHRDYVLTKVRRGIRVARGGVRAT